MFEASDVEVGDVVFCQVYPSREYYADLIMSKTYDDEVEAWYFTVENQSGRENGWCWMDTIYGKLKQICRNDHRDHHTVDGEAASAGAVTW